MSTIVDQLREAFEASELTVPELLDRAGLDLDRSSLHRKLRGELALKTSEAEALATALGVAIAWNAPRRSARRSA